MTWVGFDTLKLAQRLETAGLPPRQAQDVASAIADSIAEAAVTPDYVDMRVREIRTSLGELQNELKLMFGAIGLQTLVLLAGMAILLRLFS